MAATPRWFRKLSAVEHFLTARGLPVSQDNLTVGWMPAGAAGLPHSVQRLRLHLLHANTYWLFYLEHCRLVTYTDQQQCTYMCVLSQRHTHTPTQSSDRWTLNSPPLLPRLGENKWVWRHKSAPLSLPVSVCDGGWQSLWLFTGQRWTNHSCHILQNTQVFMVCYHSQYK